MIYMELTIVCDGDGLTNITNKTLAELYGVTPNTISKCITELKKEGFIYTFVDYDNTRYIALKLSKEELIEVKDLVDGNFQ